MTPIQHTVTFRLNAGADQGWFLDKARELADLPGVRNFEVLEQIGKKATQFSLALSMWFDTEDAYAGYNDHPTHVEFVQTV